MVLPREFRLAFVVMASALLAGCSYIFSLQDTRVISPPSQECTAERYLPVIEGREDDFSALAGPDWSMPLVYDVIAPEILALPPITAGRCEIEFAFGRYPDDQYEKTMIITEDQSSLCLIHLTGLTNRDNARRVCFDR
jgi:hypothetical protein